MQQLKQAFLNSDLHNLDIKEKAKNTINTYDRIISISWWGEGNVLISCV